MTVVMRVNTGEARYDRRMSWIRFRDSCMRRRRHDTERACIGWGRHGERKRHRKRPAKDRCVQMTQNMPVLFGQSISSQNGSNRIKKARARRAIAGAVTAAKEPAIEPDIELRVRPFMIDTELKGGTETASAWRSML
jgi:hypothetical protein